MPWAQAPSAAAPAVARTYAAVCRLIDLALPVLSMPEEMTAVGAADVEQDDVVGALLGPEAQVVTCACWMSAKEGALVLGTLCQLAPRDNPKSLVPGEVLRGAGALLLRAMLGFKHSGAVDKTQQGLTAIAATLLGAPDAALAALPQAWMEETMAHLLRPGQSLRDIMKRSAGLPLVVQGLMHAQPGGGKGGMADRGMTQLLEIAAAGGRNADVTPDPWPRVHAFNTLKLLFMDTRLARAASTYYAQGASLAVFRFVLEIPAIFLSSGVIAPHMRDNFYLPLTRAPSYFFLYRLRGVGVSTGGAPVGGAQRGHPLLHRPPAAHAGLLQPLISRCRRAQGPHGSRVLRNLPFSVSVLASAAPRRRSAAGRRGPRPPPRPGARAGPAPPPETICFPEPVNFG